MSKFTDDDKICPHCHGNLSWHSLGEVCGLMKWCDSCGANDDRIPPNIEIREITERDMTNNHQPTIQDILAIPFLLAGYSVYIIALMIFLITATISGKWTRKEIKRALWEK